MSTISGINSNNMLQANEQYITPNSNNAVGRQTKDNSMEVSNALDEKLINAIEKANQIQTGTTECQFSIHQSTKQIMIKLVDTTTHQVVKEIPSEKILDMVAKMCDLAGLFVDERR